jgi:hypothetical protein
LLRSERAPWESVSCPAADRRALEHAKELINEGKFVYGERDAWSEHQPSAQQENEFIRLHGFAEYGKWYLGINAEKPADTKGHYEFPYGDFKKVHRCALLSAESRAGQYKHYDIESAAYHLHGLMDGRKSDAWFGEKIAEYQCAAQSDDYRSSSTLR